MNPLEGGSPKVSPPSEEKIVLLYKKVSGKGEIDGDFYEWLCEEFCEKEPWDCDGNCPFLEK